MDLSMYYLALSPIYLFMVLIGAYLFATWRIETHLKAQHFEIWCALGSPHILFNHSPKHTSRVRRFLNERSYESLDDPILVRKVKLQQRLLLGVKCSFVLIAVVIVTLTSLRYL